MSSHTIRRAAFGDEQGIHSAHMSSVQEVCCNDYNEAQINAWGRREFNLESRRRSIEASNVWVVEVDCKIEGYAQLDIRDSSAYISGLYITKKLLSRGIGRELLSTMTNFCSSMKVRKVTLNSTITSKSFYERNGFKVTGPMENGAIGGVPIEDYPMELSLSSRKK